MCLAVVVGAAIFDSSSQWQKKKEKREESRATEENIYVYIDGMSRLFATRDDVTSATQFFYGFHFITSK